MSISSSLYHLDLVHSYVGLQLEGPEGIEVETFVIWFGGKFVMWTDVIFTM